LDCARRDRPAEPLLDESPILGFILVDFVSDDGPVTAPTPAPIAAPAPVL